MDTAIAVAAGLDQALKHLSLFGQILENSLKALLLLCAQLEEGLIPSLVDASDNFDDISNE